LSKKLTVKWLVVPNQENVGTPACTALHIPEPWTEALPLAPKTKSKVPVRLSE
jgi:hypothetical protein